MSCGPGLMRLAFDTANPEAVAWAENHAAELITNIATDAREAIRLIVSEGIEAGVGPKETAKLIRASIGLTERDAGAVMRRHLTMLADGVDPATAVGRAERYASKLLRTRALTIARTETMRAANEGQQQLWEQAQEKGLLNKSAKKVWITADPCPRCAPLDGETVNINESFSVGEPPLHPRCRCTTGLV